MFDISSLVHVLISDTQKDDVKIFPRNCKPLIFLLLAALYILYDFFRFWDLERLENFHPGDGD